VAGRYCHSIRKIAQGVPAIYSGLELKWKVRRGLEAWKVASETPHTFGDYPVYAESHSMDSKD
jgi:hypothetical protein